MIRRRLALAGVAVLAAGIAMFAYGFGHVLPDVHAVQEFTPTNTSVPPTIDPCLDAQAMPGGAGRYMALGEDCETPTATVKVNTKTPTDTATAAATEVPPSATQRPATVAPTQPSGGAGAGGVRPPNTGTGGDSGTSTWTWLIAGGAALAVLGGAGIAAGSLRRRG